MPYVLPLRRLDVEEYSDARIIQLLDSFKAGTLSGVGGLQISVFEFSKTRLSGLRRFDTQHVRSRAVSSWAKGRFMLATPSIRLLFVSTPDVTTAKASNAHARRQLYDEVRDELKPALLSLGFPERLLETFDRVVLDAIPIRLAETKKAPHEDPNIVYHISLGFFSLMYRYDPDLKTHTGIVLGQNNQELFSRLIQNIIDYRGYIGHPHILPIATQRAVCSELSSWMEVQKEAIKEAQSQTGYHQMLLIAKTRKLVDYSELSARMVGTAINIATTSLCWEILAAHGHILMHGPDDEASMEDHEMSKLCACTTAFLQQEVCRLRGDIQVSLLEVRSWELKATMIVQGIFNLIAQQDQNTSIGIARDSRILAAESKRDSTSMKTLAVVTMAFLPGAFVAAVLAIPVFHWDATDTSNIIGHRLWIYWSITIPLTLVTFLVWFVWIKYVSYEKDNSQWVRSEVNAPKSP
ncbi:hypothetical protein F5Y03DRAFT_379986 [Xylaria venustula]|nr:hypothetical protein F5Y03DRAFT_379986 [Xylaria venustula]